MTQNDINNFNRRCADFLGIEYNEGLSLFHSDWNLIHSVIEKIEKLKFDFQIISRWDEFNECTYTTVSIIKEEAEMSPDRAYRYNHVRVYEKHTTLPCKKEAIMQAINKFFTYYNGTKEI